MKTSLIQGLAAAFTLSAGLLSPAMAASHPAFQVEVKGSGAPMILIPGLASPGAVWDGTVRRYCGRRQCHVLTLAGFAGAPAIDAPLLPAVERQLADYITANKMDKPVLIGHSLGGFLALKLAASQPGLVGRVVVVDALPALGATQVPSVTTQQLEAMAAQMRDGMLQADDAGFAAQQRHTAGTMITGQQGVDRVVEWSLKSDRKAMAGALYQMLSQDLRPELARIQSPTLVLGSWAAYKSFLPRAAVEGLYGSQYQKLAGVRIELTDKARHFIMYDDPDWMYARIDQFLE